MASTPSLTFEEFAAQAQAQGYPQALVRTWDPGHVTPEHDHPFDTHALVVEGEFWLTVGDDTRHFQAGDTFELSRHILHRERYGAQGAIFWAARRI